MTTSMSDDGGRLAIAPLSRSHLREVERIDALVYPEPWSHRLWTLELEREHRIYVAALWQRSPATRRERPIVVGYAGAMLGGEDLHVMTIVSDPALQGRGIGTNLMLAIVEGGIAMGATALTLEVRVTNSAAQALYRRFGLAPAGVRRGYFEPDGEDALIMWAHDIDGPDYRARLAAIAERPLVRP